MNAYDRHKKMVHDLVAFYGGQLPQGGQASAGFGKLCISVQGAWAWAHGGGVWELVVSRQSISAAAVDLALSRCNRALLPQAAPAKSDWDILRDNFRWVVGRRRSGHSWCSAAVQCGVATMGSLLGCMRSGAQH